ncbi:hypothetical protein [Sphingomonas sp. CFBP 13706]|uniref:hypothetical protein n=1 Tax=Sphingomonas sp. CFBP 13706 TaxID=2775314 RepID=UPI001A7E4869|nr:hypothetical protein [Sphingomonas sp. CFBP 13706]
MSSRSALEAIWCGGDAQGGTMLPLRAHAALLADTIFEIVNEQPKEFIVWHAVSDQLRMSSFVEDIHARSPGSIDFCGGFAESDLAFGEMAQLWLGGTIIFGLVWQAYELSVLARKPNSTSQGEDGIKLISAAADGRKCPHLVEITEAVVANLSHLASELPDKRRKKILKGIAEIDICLAPAKLAASSLAYLRNALIHGQLVAPLTSFGDEDDDPIENDHKIRVFHNAIRLTLILIQLLFAAAFPEGEETEAGGDLVEIGEFMQNLHMKADPISRIDVSGTRS